MVLSARGVFCLSGRQREMLRLIFFAGLCVKFWNGALCFF